MNNQTAINSLINQGDWESLVVFLKTEQGVIGNLGGRYICRKENYTKDDCADINAICWNIWKASLGEEFDSIAPNECVAVSNVIKELRRLYDETDIALSKASYPAYVATTIYDLFEIVHDGYQPINRIEDVVLTEMREKLSVSNL